MSKNPPFVPSKQMKGVRLRIKPDMKGERDEAWGQHANV